jgi:hypothetical protein
LMHLPWLSSSYLLSMVLGGIRKYHLTHLQITYMTGPLTMTLPGNYADWYWKMGLKQDL